MRLSELFSIGEQLLELQPKLKQAQEHHPKAAHTQILMQQAAKLTHDYMRVVDPAPLMEAIRGLGRDAARYQYLRNEATVEQQAWVASLTPEEADAYLDGLIEETFNKEKQS